MFSRKFFLFLWNDKTFLMPSKIIKINRNHLLIYSSNHLLILKMILAIDVHYREDFAKSASIEFDNWAEENILQIHETIIDEVEEYVPGEFYKRELPCLLQVIELSDREAIDLIIVDSYVVLNDDGKPGLGAYLYEALNKEIPVIGVAKKNFLSNTKNVREVLRGESQKPLYVSSMGIDIDEAAEKIKHMKGEYRLPEMLKLVDRKGRE